MGETQPGEEAKRRSTQRSGSTLQRHDLHEELDAQTQHQQFEIEKRLLNKRHYKKFRNLIDEKNMAEGTEHNHKKRFGTFRHIH